MFSDDPVLPSEKSFSGLSSNGQSSFVTAACSMTDEPAVSRCECDHCPNVNDICCQKISTRVRDECNSKCFVCTIAVYLITCRFGEKMLDWTSTVYKNDGSGKYDKNCKRNLGNFLFKEI